MADPLSVTSVPLPRAAGEIVPEMVQVGIAVAVKLTPVTLAPLTVTEAEAGEKV